MTTSRRSFATYATWALSTGLAAFAQQPVNTSGRLFDANPAVGSSRINALTPSPSAFVGGNAFATGNVRGGMALRSFSPISDPTAFRGNLGSTSLSGFMRDSVTVGDIYYQQSGGYGTGRFFDPSGSVATVGTLSNRYQAYISSHQQGATGNPMMVLPGLLNYSAGSAPPPVARFDTGLTPRSSATPSISLSPLTPVGPTPAGGLFGVSPGSPRTPTAMLAPEAPGISDPRASSSISSPLGAAPLASRALPNTRLDLRETVAPVGATLDQILRAEPGSLLDARRPNLLPDTPPITAVPDQIRPTPETPMAARPPTVPRDRSMLPGNDVFTDMRLALSLSKDPTAAWWNDVQDAMKASEGTQVRTTQAKADVEAQTFIDSVMKTPLRTFAGEGESRINEELLKAEALLHVGQYYDAAARFQQAHALDPANPLPLIGRGNALLAAGDYLSAAIQLVRGFERFPDLARFDVDLRAFLGGGEIIDIRRADIMQQLERNEVSELRFLLGYLEYYSGDKDRGLNNLDKAAAGAEFGSIITRFPDMLRGTRMLPPPRISPAAPTAPEESKP